MIPADQFFARVLANIYATRPCFICGKKLWCGHREPQVDLAEFVRDFNAYAPPKKENDTCPAPNAAK